LFASLPPCSSGMIAKGARGLEMPSSRLGTGFESFMTKVSGEGASKATTSRSTALLLPTFL